MALKLRVASKNLYEMPLKIFCPQDGNETQEVDFKVRFERFKHSEVKRFRIERAAVAAYGGKMALRVSAAANGADAQTTAEMLAEYDKVIAKVGADFDFDADLYVRWMQKKVKGFPGLPAEDENGNEVAVTPDDIPDLMEDMAYRLPLIELLEKQMEDPGAEERKNSESSGAGGPADRTKP